MVRAKGGQLLTLTDMEDPNQLSNRRSNALEWKLLLLD